MRKAPSSRADLAKSYAEHWDSRARDERTNRQTRRPSRDWMQKLKPVTAHPQKEIRSPRPQPERRNEFAIARRDPLTQRNFRLSYNRDAAH